MNNIWKYSLVLAFSIIVDQLIKGTAQSLIVNDGGVVHLFGPLSFVRIRNLFFIFGFNISFLSEYINAISLTVCTGLIFWTLKKIVINRNINPLKGWAYTLFLIGLFSSWLDRVTQGFTLSYLKVDFGFLMVPFSVGDIFFFCGIIAILFMEIREWAK